MHPLLDSTTIMAILPILLWSVLALSVASPAADKASEDRLIEMKWIRALDEPLENNPSGLLERHKRSPVEEGQSDKGSQVQDQLKTGSAVEDKVVTGKQSSTNQYAGKTKEEAQKLSLESISAPTDNISYGERTTKSYSGGKSESYVLESESDTEKTTNARSKTISEAGGTSGSDGYSKGEKNERAEISGQKKTGSSSDKEEMQTMYSPDSHKTPSSGDTIKGDSDGESGSRVSGNGSSTHKTTNAGSTSTSSSGEISGSDGSSKKGKKSASTGVSGQHKNGSTDVKEKMPTTYSQNSPYDDSADNNNKESTSTTSGKSSSDGALYDKNKAGTGTSSKQKARSSANSGFGATTSNGSTGNNQLASQYAAPGSRTDSSSGSGSGETSGSDGTSYYEKEISTGSSKQKTGSSGRSSRSDFGAMAIDGNSNYNQRSSEYSGFNPQTEDSYHRAASSFGQGIPGGTNIYNSVKLQMTYPGYPCNGRSNSETTPKHSAEYE